MRSKQILESLRVISKQRYRIAGKTSFGSVLDYFQSKKFELRLKQIFGMFSNNFGAILMSCG